jgi:colicin import membrane protein
METEEKGLIIPEKINALEIYSEPGKVDPILEEITRKAKDFVADTTTAKGRAEIKSMAYKVSQSKTFLDDLGKQLVADKKEEIKKVDSSRKYIRDKLDALRDEVRKPYEDWEAEQERIKEEARLAEVARIEAEQARIKYEQEWEEAIAENIMFDRRKELERKEKQLEAQLAEQRRKDEESRKERERLAREEQIRKDEAARIEKEKQEALTAAAKSRQQMLKEFGLEMELDVLRAMPEQVWNEFYSAKSKEFQAKQIEAQKLESERKEKEEAELIERDKKEAAEKAEREKQAAIEEEKRKAKEEADRKEAERLENERKEKERLEAERLAEEKRISNTRHQNKIKKEASASMLSVLQETFQTYFPLDKVSDLIVDAIAAGKITHLSIKF